MSDEAAKTLINLCSAISETVFAQKTWAERRQMFLEGARGRSLPIVMEFFINQIDPEAIFSFCLNAIYPYVHVLSTSVDSILSGF